MSQSSKNSSKSIKKFKIKPVKETLVYPLRIGFLSDLHLGSTRAIFPKNKHKMQDGGIIIPNEIQLYIRKLWERNIYLFDKYRIQYICIVGDICAGLNRIEAGNYIEPVDLEEQVEMTISLLKEFYDGMKEKPVFLVWSGTGYHEAQKTIKDVHRGLVDKLKLFAQAEYCGDVSYLEIDMVKRVRRVFIAHESPMFLGHPATMQSRDIEWFKAAEAKGHVLPIDAVVRAHLHCWQHLDQSGLHHVQLPCWLGYVPYKSTIKYFPKLQPGLGGSVLMIDEYGRFDFWGGSYPFGFNRREYLQLHKLCITRIGLDPTLETKYKKIVEKCLL